MKSENSLKTFLFTAGVTIPSLYAAESFAQQRQNYHWPMGHMMDGWGMGWIGFFMMILFWITVIALGIALIRYLVHNTWQTGQDSRRGESGRAVEILKERYARGEIDKQEFEEKKKDLM